jgi:hypothetical protein
MHCTWRKNAAAPTTALAAPKDMAAHNFYTIFTRLAAIIMLMVEERG